MLESRFGMAWPIRVDIYSLHDDVAFLGPLRRRGPSRSGSFEKEQCANRENCRYSRNACETYDWRPRSGKSHGRSLLLICKVWSLVHSLHIHERSDPMCPFHL